MNRPWTLYNTDTACHHQSIQCILWAMFFDVVPRLWVLTSSLSSRKMPLTRTRSFWRAQTWSRSTEVIQSTMKFWCNLGLPSLVLGCSACKGEHGVAGKYELCNSKEAFSIGHWFSLWLQIQQLQIQPWMTIFLTSTLCIILAFF